MGTPSPTKFIPILKRGEVVFLTSFAPVYYSEKLTSLFVNLQIRKSSLSKTIESIFQREKSCWMEANLYILTHLDVNRNNCEHVVHWEITWWKDFFFLLLFLHEVLTIKLFLFCWLSCKYAPFNVFTRIMISAVMGNVYTRIQFCHY